jgi:hypothetical protein
MGGSLKTPRFFESDSAAQSGKSLPFESHLQPLKRITRLWCKWRCPIGYVGVLSWLRSSMGKLKAVAELFEGRHFDREVIILCARAPVSSVQAQSARLGGDDGRARPIDGAYDDHALGAALRPGV